MWHADAASITSCNDCRQAGNKFWELRANVVHKTSQACIIFFLQLLGKSMPALVLLPVAMTGAAMTARSKSSSMSLGSFD